MRSFWTWKNNILGSIIFLNFGLLSQDSTSAIQNFDNKKVFYTDLGYNTSPFSIKYPFNEEVEVLKYRNNFKTFMGVGFAYKWFHLRIGFPVFGFVKSVDRWGDSQQFQIGFDFSVKHLFFDVDFNTVQGYAIKNYGDIDSTFNNSISNHLISGSLGSTNLSVNAWYFRNKDFKMSALRVKQAHYKETVKTWYIKSTFNGFGVENQGDGIIPPLLFDNSISKTMASVYSAIDFGIIPGYAFVARLKNWQISGWMGVGGVIQSKFYSLNNSSRGFIGLQPRYDVRFIGGYTDDTYFILLDTEFDNKSISFNNLKYRQYYYSIRLTAGIRFN